MKRDQELFEFNTGVIGYPIVFVLMIWIVFWAEVRLGLDIKQFGVYPRTFVGLRGVLFSPFIHSDMTHLWHNTLPLFILSSALFYFYNNNAWRILVIGALLTGILTWILGRPANHIGASGIVYLLFGFLFFKGIIARNFRLMALSFVVVFIYGSMVWYVFPVDPKISWEGHFSGLFSGALLAFLIRKGIAKPKAYSWESPDYNPEEDEFLKHFDEDGNFIETLPEDEDPEEIINQEIKINYEYKENKKREGL